MRKMKDSGIDWIGEIPEGWEARSLKSLFGFGKGLPITKENLTESGVSVISYGQIHSKTNDGVHITSDLIRFVDENYIQTNPSSLVAKYDFIFADTSEDLEGCGNCVFNNLDTTLFAGYHTIILQSNTGYNNQYFAYLFKSDIWRKQIREQVTGVKLFSISQKILKSVSVIVPPLSEQQKIAAHLDRVCAEIDSITAKTKATIEEYKKLKQAIITQAVTKGIRKGRKMKDSGVEWIGEIPEEWERIKLFRAIKNIGDIDHYMPESVDEGITYLMTGDLTESASRIDLDKCKKISIADYEKLSKKIAPEKDDVIFARYATIGTVCYVDISIPFLVSYSCLTIKTNKDMLWGKYLFYYLKSDTFYLDISQYIKSNTQANVGLDSMSKSKIILPSLNEQQEIANHLDEKCAAIDTLISKKEQLLTELESYKKSVIYEYVTGKKEV